MWGTVSAPTSFVTKGVVTKGVNMNWYYRDGDQQVGPVANEAMQALIKAGVLLDTTPVWHEGMSDWAELGQTELVVQLQVPVPPAPPLFRGVSSPSATGDKSANSATPTKAPGSHVSGGIAEPSLPGQLPGIPGAEPLSVDPFTEDSVWEQEKCAERTAPQASMITPGLVAPRNPPRSPGWMTAASLLWPGLGQLMCGQTVKGVILMIVSSVASFASGGASGLLLCPLGGFDAYRVAKVLASGRSLPEWSFFPS